MLTMYPWKISGKHILWQKLHWDGRKSLKSGSLINAGWGLSDHRGLQNLSAWVRFPVALPPQLR